MKDLLKKEIIIAVIASILFTYFFQPIINITWNFIISTSNNIFHNWLDKVYKNAAFGENNRIDFTLLFFSFNVLFIYLLNLNLNNLPSNLIAEIEDKANANEGEDEKISVEELEKKLIETKKQLALSMANYKRRVKKSFVIILTASSVMIFSVFLLIVQEYVAIQLNTSFEQRLTVLATKISVQEYNDLKASWVTMLSREDYKNIEIQMNMLAAEYEIELPKPLLP